MTDEQLATLLSLLESSHQLDPASPAFLAVERASAHLAKSAKKKRRLARSQRSRAADVALTLRDRDGLAEAPELNRERSCYVCKRPYRTLHPRYAWLCPECGARSLSMRALPLELHGRRALITGGRVKVGQATALALLRAGAEVHLTTRFANDAARRYAEEPDAASWRGRLHVHRLDLRDLGGLLAALERWCAGPPFDIVINNAAQSVWHPPEYFEALLRGEGPSAEASRAPSALAVPLLHGDLARLDLQREDSWVQSLGEIAPVDMVEVQVVNAIAPFFIVNRLRESLRRSPHALRFVVNVTAVEGQFERPEKLTRHPHTNMAKAGLNMLTRTSAADLKGDGISMVSVDPGWMSREGRVVDPGFLPPLTAADCAARVLHPIAAGLAGAPLWGVLLKDFEEVPW